MIYLDNAATTLMDPRVIDVMTESMRRDFANPGTVYRIGLDAKSRIEKAREEIAEMLRVPSNYRIVFTSGGSESNNLFIKGSCSPDKKAAHLGLEHPSITETLDYLKPLVCPHKEGRLDLDCIPVLKENRVRLLCLSHVNHEIGSVNDPCEILRAVADYPLRLFVDGVQAVGKLIISPNQWRGVASGQRDVGSGLPGSNRAHTKLPECRGGSRTAPASAVAGYSISGHKIHGPKGIGLLIYDAKVDLVPQIHGGKQQYGVRSGTLATPLILGLAEAVKLAVGQVEETQTHLRKLRNRLIDGLRDLASRSSNLNIRFNSPVVDDPNLQSPAIVNFGFFPVEGEVVLHHLEEKDIYVGLGSACSAHSKQPSRILTGIGLSKEEARCSLRISFSRQNIVEEVDVFLKEFSRAYELLYPTFCVTR